VTNLAPGRYLIRVQINKRVHEQEVDLAAGDYLLTSLNADGDRLRFNRVVYGAGYRKDRHADQGNWLLTVFQDRLNLPERSLDMMVTLENQSEKVPKAGSILQQIRPRVTWLELKPQQGDAEAAIRWGDLPGYPAPAWSLHVPRWPQREGRAQAARPDVEAWWMWQKNAPVAATLEWKRDFSLEGAFLGTRVLDNDANIKITIDSVGFETHRVKPDPDAPPHEERCLVVRARYPKGHRIWIEPVGLQLNALQQEHQYYDAAERYAAIFWPLNEDQVRNNLEGFHIVLVEEFKKAALHVGKKLEDLPSPEDTRPKPVTRPK
jgi:hypothetical protein